MLKTLFEDLRTYLNCFFEKIDLNKVQKILDRLLECQGMVIFSGVGKSGRIAEKISATFLSTGTRSFFLDPLNALHGDIGMVCSQDVFVCLSKSGNSEEIVQLLPFVRSKGAFVIAVISSEDSLLEKLSDLSVILPIEREICPYNLAPTTSSIAQLIFGDCLSIALMQAKQFGIKEFAANHPSGTLGRKITMKVFDLMQKGESLPFCKPDDLLLHVLHELSAKRCGCLLVVGEEKKLHGIFTDGDLRRAIQNLGPLALQMPLSNLMTAAPKSIRSDQLAVEAVRKMEEDPSRLITVLPVVENDKVIGLIRMHDILQKEFA